MSSMIRLKALWYFANYEIKATWQKAVARSLIVAPVGVRYFGPRAAFCHGVFHILKVMSIFFVII